MKAFGIMRVSIACDGASRRRMRAGRTDAPTRQGVPGRIIRTDQASFALTIAETLPMSARPASFGLSRHHLAHVGGAGGAGLGDRLGDQRVDLGLAAAAAACRPRARRSRTAPCRRGPARAGLELRDRIAALLDHLLDHRDHVGVGELHALVDFALLDRREQQAERRQAMRRPSRASRSSCRR